MWIERIDMSQTVARQTTWLIIMQRNEILAPEHHKSQLKPSVIALNDDIRMSFSSFLEYFFARIFF